MLRRESFRAWSALAVGGFARNGAGVAAVEFALIAPFLFMLLLAGFDLGRFVLATQRVERVAGSVAQMLAETPVSNSASTVGDGVVSANDLLFYWNSAMFTFPDALAAANAQGANWWNLLDVQMSSIKFVPTPTGCTTTCSSYTPKVMWSLGNRTCGSTITAVSDTNYYSPTTLPTDVFVQGPPWPAYTMIVVDVTYSWTPTIGAAYLGSIPIVRSVYLAPRTATAVESQAYGLASPCP